MEINKSAEFAGRIPIYRYYDISSESESESCCDVIAGLFYNICIQSVIDNLQKEKDLKNNPLNDE